MDCFRKAERIALVWTILIVLVAFLYFKGETSAKIYNVSAGSPIRLSLVIPSVVKVNLEGEATLTVATVGYASIYRNGRVQMPNEANFDLGGKRYHGHIFSLTSRGPFEVEIVPYYSPIMNDPANVEVAVKEATGKVEVIPFGTETSYFVSLRIPVVCGIWLIGIVVCYSILPKRLSKRET